MRCNPLIFLATVAVLLAVPTLAAPDTPGDVTPDAADERVRELLRRHQSTGTHRPPALRASTVAASASPQAVTTPAQFSLSLDDSLNLGASGGIFIAGSPLIHVDSGTALGLYALTNTTGGDGHNSAVGFGALYFNEEGSHNTAVGSYALLFNIGYQEGSYKGGFGNTAVGYGALRDNAGDVPYNGSVNTAVGLDALGSNVTGTGNTASGGSALNSNTTGDLNTAVGAGAGQFWTTGSDNIALGSGASGVAGEEKTIRIGGNDMQTRTFIEGIANAGMTFATQVCIDTITDQLGPCSASSARFKQDIEPLADLHLDDLHRALSALQLVSFRYRGDFTGEQEPSLQYGLIAEEVAEIFPSLVTTDAAGRPHTVRYDLLTPLLLAEVQRQELELARLRSLDDEVAELRRLVGDLAAKNRPLAR